MSTIYDRIRARRLELGLTTEDLAQQLGYKDKSSISKIEGPEDISGLKIIVGSGTNQEQVLLTWNKQLESEGKAPAELAYYDDNAAATLAIQSGRAAM